MWLIYSSGVFSVVGQKSNGEDDFVTTVSITVILQTKAEMLKIIPPEFSTNVKFGCVRPFSMILEYYYIKFILLKRHFEKILLYFIVRMSAASVIRTGSRKCKDRDVKCEQTLTFK